METQNRGMELALFLTLPAMVALIVAAEPIVRGLFQYGHFTPADTVKCAWALAGFSIGLPSYILVKVLTPGFYARQDTKTPVRYATLSMVVNLVGNLLLIVPLKHIGPPLATALASTVNVWLLYRTLVARGHFAADARLRRRAPRLALAALAMGVVLWLTQDALTPYVHGTWIVRCLALAALVSAGGVVYGLATVLLGAFSKDDLRLLLRRRRTT